MSNNVDGRLSKYALRAVRELVWMLAPPKVLLIHTPKCAGTYLRRQYDIDRNWRIRNVGHADFRSLRIASTTKIVGLVRDPADWYASYYFFCRQQLSNAPQSATNFPAQHPISVFTENGNASLERMITNMANREFLDRVIATGMQGNVYARNIDDIFGFMQRTESGFWTWTMMYHFSRHDTREMQSKVDVVKAAKEIGGYVNFIHQEKIDEDVESILQLPLSEGARLNTSSRPSRHALDEATTLAIKNLDGDVAYVLGGYRY